jgi:hypothetical protein
LRHHLAARFLAPSAEDLLALALAARDCKP